MDDPYISVVLERAVQLYDAAVGAAQVAADEDPTRGRRRTAGGRMLGMAVKFQSFDKIPTDVRDGWLAKARGQLETEGE